jgi:hypothetical protein
MCYAAPREGCCRAAWQDGGVEKEVANSRQRLPVCMPFQPFNMHSFTASARLTVDRLLLGLCMLCVQAVWGELHRVGPIS